LVEGVFFSFLLRWIIVTIQEVVYNSRSILMVNGDKRRDSELPVVEVICFIVASPLLSIIVVKRESQVPT